MERECRSADISANGRCRPTKSEPPPPVGTVRRLWYYLLREADVRTGGCRLGPIGGRIVGEVLVGLLELDPSSVFHAPQSWKPSATLVELLTGLDHR